MTTHVIAKTLVFNEAGELLLLTRSARDDHRPGGLDLPGGKVEDGEDSTAGAAREALEEAGLSLDPAGMQLVYADTRATYNTDAKEDVNMVRLTFAARTANPTVVLSPEHDGFAWYTLDKAMPLLKGTRYHEILAHLQDHNIVGSLWPQ